MGSLQPVFATEKSDALPDAPATAIRTSLCAAERTDIPADPQSHASTTSSDSDNSGFLTRWVKRGLRDQSDIYTTPFHRSEVKWVIGLPAMTLGLIAIDKHASGALPRNRTNASTDISNVGLFTTAGTLGVILLDGMVRDNPQARETGVLGAESVANSGLLYVVLQLITQRQRPLQDAGRGHFFQTSGLDNSFPSGHTIITVGSRQHDRARVPQALGGVAHLWHRHGRICHALYQLAALPLRAFSV